MDSEISLSAQRWVFLLTVSWCCIYVVANTAFQIRLRQLVANNPLTYPESLTAKAGAFANYVTSTLNSLIALSAVVLFLPVMIKSGFDSDNTSVNGPLLPGTDIVYLCFIAYVIYDTIYECVLCEHPLSDAAILGHHLIYLVTTCLLYQTGSFPLLTLVLFTQELSTPFLNVMHTLKVFSRERTLAFTLNAWALTITFFIFRAICPGIALGLILVSPPKSWSLSTVVIISFVIVGYLMQLFWFTKIAKGLAKHVASEKEEEVAPLLNADIAAGGSL